MADKFNFDKVIAALERSKRELPIKLGNLTKNEFVGNWSKQGFGGVKWQEVQRRTPGTKAYKYAKPAARTRAILVGKGSGRLRRDVANSLKEATFERIKFVVNNPYGQYHNEGTDKLPKRQFMGQTRDLTNKQMALIKKEIGRIWPQ